MPPQKTEEAIEETPFNMAMIFYISLNKLMDLRDRASIEGNILLWYKCSHRIYLRVRFKFNETEQKSFNTKFKEAKEYLATAVTSRSVAKQVNNLVTENVSDILDDIDSELMVTMNKYKMIFPKIEVGSLKDLAKRYGFDG